LIPHQFTQEKIASDDVLDYLKQCSALIWFDYPSCSEVAKVVMKQPNFPSLVTFVTLSWTLGKIVIIIGHPANENQVLRLLTLFIMEIENRL
jgi:hypothetical protein